MKCRSISISISLSTLSIAESEGSVTSEAVACVAIVGFAEDAHGFAGVRG